MQRQTVICGPSPKILLNAVPGDLRVTGWEREEISAKTKGSSLELLGDADGFTVSCDNDLILNVPDGAELTVESVGGDTDLRAFCGACCVTQVSGDLSGRGLGSFQTQGVGGNLSLRGASGGISAASVGGDVSLRAAQADISLEGVGGDLYLRGASGDISASVGGDAVLFIEPRPGADVNVNAGGDIILRLPADADASLEMRGGGSVQVNLPGTVLEPETSHGQLTLGNGSARIRLNAGGEVTVTSQADEWESAADFDFDFDMDFTDMPADLSGRIQRQVERAARQTERAQRSADAAIRRAEQKLQNAERRIQAKVNARVGRWGVDWSGSIPRPPRPPAPPSEPVSDEERLTILRMLAEKKITAQEAEKLLAALE